MNIVQMNGAQPTDNDSASAGSKKPEKPLRFVTNYGAPHPKRRRIGAACLTCRKRKTACSGERPFCDTCKQNKLDCAGYSNEGVGGSSTAITNTNKRTESDQPRPANESKQATSKTNERGTHEGRSDSRTSSTQHASSTSNSSNQVGGELSPGEKAVQDANAPGVPATAPEQPLFAGPRNRMPYFRWLGPTAIMPGFKQMVVKVKRQESELTRSSTDGGGAAGMKSPSLNNTSSGTDRRVPSRYNTTPATMDSETRSTPINLPFYDNSAMPPSELITHLGQTFFKHLGCNYPFLQRDRFLQDLEEKHVDAILVDAVCALAARFSTHELLTEQRNSDGSKFAPAEYGSAFGMRAKNSLINTFSVPSVAAVQAALLLAYNEFGESRDSGLWMYLGIAIRLAQDLGMQNVQGLKYKGMEGPTPRQVKRHSMCESDYNKPTASSKQAENSIDPSLEDTDGLKDIEEHKAVEQERVDTFWAIFLLDRVVASGTGRRSTLRDKDIEVSFPPLSGTLFRSDWPQPFPALIRIVHLYGRVADLLNSIKEPSDVNAETSKRLASMESQVTNFYQGLSTRLHFDAVNFQYYMKAGEGTNFVLLHFWFHMLIVLLHQPTLLKTFEGKMLQLFPNSQQLSMSSAKTIADILSYSQLMDAKASLGNPFTTQPIYIAACAFLKESADQTASSNAHSRASSPTKSSGDGNSTGKRSGTGTPKGTPKGNKKYSASGGSIATPSGPRTPATGTVADRRSLAKHTLLATAASQHYQLCYKALQSLETYWGGTKYILTVLSQKFEGVGDPVLYTAEEGESSMEAPKPDPSFTTPGWRRRLSWGTQSATAFGRDFLQGAEGEIGDHGKAIGWTLTGIMNSPSTNLAWHYPRDPTDFHDSALPPSQAVSDHDSFHLSAPNQFRHVRSASGPSQLAPGPKSGMQSYPTSGSAVSDASLLLGLNNTYGSSNLHSPNMMPFHSTNSTPNIHDHGPGQRNNAYPTPLQPPDMGPYPDMQPFGDMTIESQDVDMSMLGLDMMPWFDAPYGPDMMGLFDTSVDDTGHHQQQQQQHRS